MKGETCRRYALSRVVVARNGSTRPVAPGTVRRELGAVQAALNYCVREGHLTTSPKVKLPSKPAPKERWLTRTEMAWLLIASRKLRIDGRHLVRSIPAGRYTGTRKSATLALRIDETSSTDGCIDTTRGVLYRQGAGATRTKKR